MRRVDEKKVPCPKTVIGLQIDVLDGKLCDDNAVLVPE
jgi:hypothetical protein